MKIEPLFDEQFKSESHHVRTLWYGYFETLTDEDVLLEITSIVKNDLVSSIQQGIPITSWIFYRENLQGDALEEQVRSSLMIKALEKGEFLVHYNMSDFEFVAQLDELTPQLARIKEKLSV